MAFRRRWAQYLCPGQGKGEEGAPARNVRHERRGGLKRAVGQRRVQEELADGVTQVRRQFQAGQGLPLSENEFRKGPQRGAVAESQVSGGLVAFRGAPPAGTSPPHRVDVDPPEGPVRTAVRGEEPALGADDASVIP